MKNTLLLAALTGLLMLTSAQLRADDTPATPTAGGNRPGRGGANHGKFREKLLEKFDANHNGKLDPDELAKAKEFMKEKLAELEQKHPELAKKIEEKRAARKAEREAGGGANPNARKTSASPDSAAPSSTDLQKAVDSFNQPGSVKL